MELTKNKLQEKSWNEIQKMAKGIKVEGKRNKENLITAILESEQAQKQDRPADQKKQTRSKYEEIFLACVENGAETKEGEKIQELEEKYLTCSWYVYPKLRAGYWTFKTPGYFPTKTTMREALNGKTWASAKKEVRLFTGRGHILTFSAEKLWPVEEGEQDSKGNHFLMIVPAEGQKIDVELVDGTSITITRDNYLEHWQHFSNHGRAYKTARILAYHLKLNYIALPRGADNGYNKSNQCNRNYYYHCMEEEWRRYDKRGDDIQVNNPLYDIINHVEENL